MSNASAKTAPGAAAGGLDCLVFTGTDAVEAYLAAADGLVAAPPQRPDWIRLWRQTVNELLVVGILRHRGRAIFALPLEIVGFGPFRVARFPGGSHANGNFAPTRRSEPPQRADLDRLVAAIAAARPGLDAILLERLAPERDGLDNPLLALPHAPSTNVGLAINLEGGFEAVLDRHSGKRKRKKHRSQLRKYEAAGGHAVVQAGTEAEAAALLDLFFDWKARQLAARGIADPFRDDNTRAFFRRLFGEAARAGRGDAVLHGLAIGGTVRAIAGSTRCGDREICEFTAFADDEMTGTSPGDFLFYEMIATACAAGRTVFDFSVGDEGYKRQWSEIETIYGDVRLPLGFRGALAVGLVAGRAALARRLKASPRLMTLVGRRPPKPETADGE